MKLKCVSWLNRKWKQQNLRRINFTHKIYICCSNDIVRKLNRLLVSCSVTVNAYIDFTSEFWVHFILMVDFNSHLTRYMFGFFLATGYNTLVFATMPYANKTATMFWNVRALTIWTSAVLCHIAMNSKFT